MWPSHFPRNETSNPAKYSGERPEMTSSRTRSQRRPKQQKANQPEEQKMKLKTQITIFTLALAASASLVWSADRPPREATPTIEGVWQVSRQGVNCNDPNQQLGPPFPAIMTFHRDGTVTGATESPVTGPFDTAEYGLWQREPGSQNYSFREVNYRYDGNGTFIGQSCPHSECGTL